jgi:hypothetical protein
MCHTSSGVVFFGLSAVQATKPFAMVVTVSCFRSNKLLSSRDLISTQPPISSSQALHLCNFLAVGSDSYFVNTLESAQAELIQLTEGSSLCVDWSGRRGRVRRTISPKEVAFCSIFEFEVYPVTESIL